jgi:hypothetical protein
MRIDASVMEGEGAWLRACRMHFVLQPSRDKLPPGCFSKRWPVELTPSDGVLLAAERFAPLSLSKRVCEEIDKGFVYGFGAFCAIALAYGIATQGGGNPRVCWLLGGAATAGLLAGYAWKRFVRPDRALLGKIDESRLERSLFAAALLANEQHGLLRLAPDGIELRAEPTDLPVHWPSESLEQGLLRDRALSVSELVSDWRAAAYPVPLWQLAKTAGTRGLLQANPSRTGPLWIPCAAALTALDPELVAKLLDDCRLRRPELWNALQSDIETGYRRRAAAPSLRFEAGAMPDSIPVADLEARQRIDEIPADAKAVGVRGAAATWISILAWCAFLFWLHPEAPPYAPLYLPFVVAASVAVAYLRFTRKYRPPPPPPAPGSSDEEAALFRQRTVSSGPPSWRESLTSAAMASGLVCGLGLILCLYPEGGEAAYILIVAVLVVGIILKIAVARSASAREVELAVARRSRELTATQKGEPDTDEVAVSPSASAAGRPLLEMRARDLPPPTATARARTDQRRRAASFLLRLSWTAFALLVAGAVLLTGIFWRRMGYDPAFLFFAAVPLGFLVWATKQALDAWYRLRPVALQRDVSLVGRAMCYAARTWPRAGEGVIPDLGNTLRDLVAAEPEFWHDEELDIGSPLGVAPAICLVYWLFFVLIAFLIVPVLQAGGLFHAHALEGLAFTGAGLALAAGYLVYVRTARAALPQRVKLEPGVRLLMLRVFGSPSFDELISLVKPWLLVGPISHLEGYDSIVRSPEARQKLAEGRLDDVLIKTPEELAGKMAAESATVAADFRYRRHAFQCTDAVWKIAIQQMLDRSDAVVMDLSNLGPTNLGCAYELGLLLNRVQLSRVLLLVSETTDQECLRTILARAETRLSPDSLNRDDPDGAWRLLRIGGSTAPEPQESYLDWVRRLDNRLDPMQLVSHLLDMALASPRAAKDHVLGL